jgi:hypothetical protein
MPTTGFYRLLPFKITVFNPLAIVFDENALPEIFECKIKKTRINYCCREFLHILKTNLPPAIV